MLNVDKMVITVLFLRGRVSVVHYSYKVIPEKFAKRLQHLLPKSELEGDDSASSVCVPGFSDSCFYGSFEFTSLFPS